MNRILHQWSRMSPRQQAVLWGMLVAGMPILVGELLLRTLGGSYSMLAPRWSDEIGYWLQARAWHVAQFDAGYFTINEIVAPFSWSHYGPHGIFVVMIYGIVDGMQFQSIVLVNLCVFTGCCVFSAVAAQWSWRMALSIMTILTIFPFVLLMLPSSMQEMLHVGIAVVLATGFYRLMAGHAVRGWLVSAIICAMLIRPTWGLLLMPALLLETHTKVWYVRLGYAVLSLMLFGLGNYVVGGTSSPFPNLRMRYYADIHSVADLLNAAWAYFQNSLMVLQKPVHPLFSLNRALAVILVCGTVLLWIIAKVRHRAYISRAEVALHCWNIAGLYAAMSVLYEFIDGRDFRVASPHLLFSILFAVQRRQWIWMYVVVVWCVISMPAMWQQYKVVQTIRTKPHSIDTSLAQVLTFDRQKSSWCNTIAVANRYADSRSDVLMGIPPGFGVTHLTNGHPDVLKAQYMLLDEGERDLVSQSLPLQQLMTVSEGALYRNLASPCTP